jgi:hypothetical protein
MPPGHPVISLRVVEEGGEYEGITLRIHPLPPGGRHAATQYRAARIFEQYRADEISVLVSMLLLRAMGRTLSHVA